MSKRASPRLPSKTRSDKAALELDIEDEDSTEMDAEILGGLDDGSIVYDHDDDNSFSPNNDDDEVADDELNHESVIMDDEYGVGIIVDDGTVEYGDFDIHNTVTHFRMGGRHAVLGFYCQMLKTLKQGRNKLGTVYVLCNNNNKRLLF
jgi:hypothetical protein